MNTVPDWLRSTNSDPAYWAEVEAVVAEDGPLCAFEDHDPGECHTCDAARLRQWREGEDQSEDSS